MKARAWKAFFPIPSMARSDIAPAADPAWLLSRGIEPGALSLIKCVRGEIASLIRSLRHLEGFHFLVHGRAEGVPCPPEDSREFIDLSLYFKRPVCFAWSEGCWVTPRAGDQTITPAIELLNAQTALYLRLVENCGDVDDFEALKQLRQSLHYFANMAQMRIA